ncbi:GSCOCG00000469001-RA-CDS [Cotesia congregata]|nr:GSCOCG00000469001-RA-CDS [Cotesia congregata]
MSNNKLLLVFFITFAYYSQCLCRTIRKRDTMSCDITEGINIEEHGYKAQDQKDLTDFLIDSRYCFRFKGDTWTDDPHGVRKVARFYKPELKRKHNCTDFELCHFPEFPSDELTTNEERLQRFVKILLGFK